MSAIEDSISGIIGYRYTLRGSVARKSLAGGLAVDYAWEPWASGYGAVDSSLSETFPSDDPNSAAEYLAAMWLPGSDSVKPDSARWTNDHIRPSFPTGGPTRNRTQAYNMVYDDGDQNQNQIQDELVSYCEVGYEYDLPQLSPCDPNDEECNSVSYSRGLVTRVRNMFHRFDGSVWDERLLSDVAYTYDAAGNRTQAVFRWTEWDGVNEEWDELSRTETYGYDSLNRLTSVNYGDSTSDSWAYDAAGNREKPGQPSYYQYDLSNRLTSVGGTAVTYSGDGIGGGIVSGGGSGRVNTWDGQNRLYKTTFTDGSNTYRSRFTYGPDGLRRLAESLDDNENVIGSTLYLLDGQNVAQEVTGGDRTTYAWGPRGPECRIAPDGSKLWYVYDGHGNVLGEVTPDGVINPDSNGNETPLRKYDVWGFVRNYQQVASNGNLKYSGSLGHPSESNTNLIYMRARYYDPVLGRFISEDPARDGGNWFAYAGNNPVGMVDPDGRVFGADDYLNLQAEDAKTSLGTLKGFSNRIKDIFDASGLSRNQFRELWHQFKQGERIGADKDVWLEKATGHIWRDTLEGPDDLGHIIDCLTGL